MATGWYIFFDGLLTAGVECVVWNEHIRKDCNATATHLKAPPGLVGGAYWAPGILSTFGAVGLNLISWEAVTDEGSFGDGVAGKARAWVIFCMILMFSGVGAAIWILAADLHESKDYYHWGGVAVMLQCIFIFLGGFLFRLVRRSGDHAI